MVAQSPVLSFMSANGEARRAIDAAQLKDLKKFLASERSEGDAFFDPTLPVFQEVVQRSTRFSTNVPAAEVILRIADIIAQDEYPLPAPYQHVRQTCRIDREAYRLDVRRGGILICTVQIFQLDTGMYMVDFRRGQLGIFQFKRFYDDILAQVQQVIKTDYSRTTRLLDTPSSNTSKSLHQLLNQKNALKRSVSNQF